MVNSKPEPVYRCGKSGEKLQARLTGAPLIHPSWQVDWWLIPSSGEPVRVPVESCPTEWREGNQLDCSIPDLTALVQECPAGLNGTLSVIASIGGRGTHGILGTTVQAHASFPHDPSLTLNTCLLLTNEAAELWRDARSVQDQSDWIRLAGDALATFVNASEVCLHQGYAEQASRDLHSAVSMGQMNPQIIEPAQLESLAGLLPQVPGEHHPLLSFNGELLSAQIFRDSGRFRMAWDSLQRASALSKTLQSAEASTLVDLSLAQWGAEMAQLDEAYQASRRCAASGWETAQPDWRAQCQELYATMAGQLGLADVALRSGGEAFWSVRNDKSEKPDRWRAGTNLGLLLLTLSDVPESSLRELLEQLRPLFDKSDVPEGARLAFEQSLVQRERSDTSAVLLAEALFREALPHWEAEHDSNHLVNDAQNLIRVLLRQEKYDEVEALLAKVEAQLKTSTEIRPQYHINAVYLQLLLALKRQDSATARRLMDQLVDLDAKVDKSAFPRWELELMQGQVAKLEGRREVAAFHLRNSAQALKLVACSANMTGFAPGFLSTHRQPADALLELLPILMTQDAQAWLRDFSFVNTLPCRAGTTKSGTNTLASRSYQRYLELEEQVFTFDQQSQQLATQQKGTAWQLERQKLKDRLYDAWLEAMAGTSETAPPAVDTAQIASLLPSNAEVWVLAALPSKIQGVRIRRSGVLPMGVALNREELLAVRRQLLEGPVGPRSSPAVERVLSTLSRLVPPDLASETRLVVVLDPMLDGMPLDALPFKNGILLDQLSAFSQAEDLETLVRDLLRPPPAPSLRPVVVVDSLPQTRPLPGSRPIALLLHQLMPGLQAFQGVEARQSAVQRASQNATLLHLGIHGEARRLDPLSARLELSDGPLTIPELQQYHLDNALVVLGACESGPGGATGATMALATKAAGARTVISSRWKLDDAATMTVEAEFYRHLNSGQSMAEALTSAVKIAYPANTKMRMRASSQWLLGDPGWR